jgi:hypothetical protein
MPIHLPSGIPKGIERLDILPYPMLRDASIMPVIFYTLYDIPILITKSNDASLMIPMIVKDAMNRMNTQRSIDLGIVMDNRC